MRYAERFVRHGSPPDHRPIPGKVSHVDRWRVTARAMTATPFGRREQNLGSRVCCSRFFEAGTHMDEEIFMASHNFREAKAQLLAAETEYRKQSSDEAVRAVEAAMARFDAARLALRQATRAPGA